MEIKIKCTGSDELSIHEIKDFQGGLKKRNERDIENILTSIQKYGFSFPFFIWKKGKTNYCLDGHGRVEALKTLKEELPKFPVIYVEAKNEEEAKNKLLRLNSKYGKVTDIGFEDFIADIDIDMDEINIQIDEIMKKELIEKGEVPFSEVLREEHNYLVLYFDNEVDWLQAETFFGVQPVKAYSTKKSGEVTKGMQRIGTGRVLNGAKAMERLAGWK